LGFGPERTQQGFPPDTISSDLIAGRTDQVIDLPNVLSKFLYMGMPLNQAIARNQQLRSFLSRVQRIRRLRVGASADVTVLELTQGIFSFVDNYRNVRTGTQNW